MRKMHDMKTATKSKCGGVGGEGKRREKEGKWTHTKALGFGPVLEWGVVWKGIDNTMCFIFLHISFTSFQCQNIFDHKIFVFPEMCVCECV